ncbi:hypothetical protein LAZ67_12001995 [Cordylochernes scorpioides]|uniref:CCHC-type domain-containing protein n=1 Tax=Cordylochernes scorpioides TaxID=51811 RepID=A0ABY6L3F3_9ARAC|nr:hypothetical protein LAZ67_12001995 [Cordylochernes scorpioides]
MVRRWRSWFLEGRQNVHDDERSGRPITSMDNAAVAAVRNVVETDRRVTIDEIMIRLPPGIEIGRSSIGTIINNGWRAARAFLEMHRRYGDQLFSRIVTGDESWVHHSTPETKRQSMVWKKPEESASKKAKVTIFAGKVMIIVFWDCMGVLLVDFLPPNTTVNAASLNDPNNAGKLQMGYFHTSTFFPGTCPKRLPSFSSTKLHLGGKHFANDDEVQAAANHWLQRQDTAWYNNGIKKLLQRYQKCFDRNGPLDKNAINQLIKVTVDMESIYELIKVLLDMDSIYELIKDTLDMESIYELIKVTLHMDSIYELIKGTLDMDSIYELIKSTLDTVSIYELIKGTLDIDSIYELIKGTLVPERPSILSQTGEDLSPKNENMKKSKEYSSEIQKNANSPAGDTHVNPAAARSDVTAPKTAATTSATPASPASLNWADSEMAEVDANDGYTVPSRPAEKPNSQQLKRPTGPRAVPPQEIKATRANIADAKARQTTTNQENYVFVELCPDLLDYSYLRAIGNLVGGPGRISQFNRMNGHYVVGLASKDHASRLVEVGLDIMGTHLKVSPSEKGQNALPSQICPASWGNTPSTTGRREAFILLLEGVRLESLPTRLTIKSKGDTLSAFLSIGIKCSKCGKQGHRRANCPALARQGNGSPRQAASPIDARPPTPSSSSSSSAAKEAGTGARNTGVPCPTGEDINRVSGDPLGAPSCRTDGSRPARSCRPPCSPGCPAAPRASHLSARPRDVGGEADLTSLHACPGRIRTQTAAEAHRGDPHPFHRLRQAARP